MKTSAWVLTVGIACTQSATAKDVEVGSFDSAQLHLNGSFCAFEHKPRETVLASDWAGKFWMKVDGKMVELVSHRTDDEVERQLAGKRWQEKISGTDLVVELSLVELGRGEDSAAYKGYVEVMRRGSRIWLPVNGGCGA